MRALDLKHFKKVKSDADKTTMQHPDGHSIHIEHKALSEQERKVLHALPFHKMASGGKVTEAPKPSPAPAPKPAPLPGSDEERKKVQDSFNGALGFAKGGSVKDQMISAEAGHVPDDRETSAPAPNNSNLHTHVANAAGVEAYKREINREYLPQQPNQFYKGGGVGDRFKEAEKGVVNPPTYNAPVPTGGPDLGASTGNLAQSVASQVDAAKAPPAMEPTPQPNPMEQAAAFTGELAGNAVAGQISSIQKQVEPQEEAFKSTQQATHNAQDQIAGEVKDYKHFADTLTKDAASLLKEMNDPAHKDINPTRYLDNMTTGQRITTALGMLISGFGGNTGDNNSVIKFINQQIQNDIHAQEKNFEHGDSLLKRYTEVLGSKEAAVKAVTAMHMGVVGLKLQEIGAKSGNAMVQAKANQEAFQLMEKVAPLLGQSAQAAAMYHAMGGSGKPGSEEQFVQQIQSFRMAKPEMAKEMESRYIPSVGVSRIPLTSEDRGKVDKIANFTKVLQRAVDFNKQVGVAGAWSSTSRAEATMLKNDLVSSLNDIKGLARFTGNEEKLYEGIIPNPGGSSWIKDNPKLFKKLEQRVNDVKENTYKQLGITPFEGAAQQSEVKTMNGVEYVKVPGGWKRK